MPTGPQENVPLVKRPPPLILKRRQAAQAATAEPAPVSGAAPTAAGGAGIAEDIDPQLRERYDRWKANLLSTASGRRDWERFKSDPNFKLTIKMSRDDERAISNSGDRQSAEQGGKASDGYRWDTNGRLVEATIVLGSRLDHGQPDKGNYPILGVANLRGDDLAAAKMAHELGHVESTRALTPEQGKARAHVAELFDQAKAAFDRGGQHDPEFQRLAAEATRAERAVESLQEREHKAEASVIEYLEDKRGDRMPGDERHAIRDYRREHPDTP